MALIFCVFLIVALLHREIATALFVFLSHSERIENGRWSFRPLAQSKQKLTVYLAKSNIVECISLRTFMGTSMIVYQNLWTSLDDSERETYVAWAMAANMRASFVERLLFRTKIEVIDRDVSLLSEKPLSFSTLIKKVIHFREDSPPSTLGHWVSGLSLIGPSILGEWPSHDERMKSIATYLADLSKSQ